MRSAIFFALFLVTVLSIDAHAQNYGQEPVKPSKITVDITDQPGCPLKLLADTPTFVPLTVKMQNTSDRPIEGFVLIIDADGGKQTYTHIRPVKTLATNGIVFENTRQFKEGKFTLSVDYVKFADGTTWGSDKFDRSKYISEYLRGRELAISRLKDMLGGVIPDDFQKALDAFGSYSISEPFNRNHPDASRRQALNGYRGVINTLRRLTKRTEEAQDLARKLELMENTLS